MIVNGPEARFIREGTEDGAAAWRSRCSSHIIQLVIAALILLGFLCSITRGSVECSVRHVACGMCNMCGYTSLLQQLNGNFISPTTAPVASCRSNSIGSWRRS